MKDAVLITVRLKSTRLAKKVLLEVDGRSVLKYLTDRLRYNLNETEIIICTSIHPEDEPLIVFSKAENLSFFQGSEDDVLGRYYEACKKFNIDRFYIIYGDEPFTDIETLKANFNLLKKDERMWIKNDSLPEGTYGYGMTFKGIEYLNEKKVSDKMEVWQLYASELPLKRIEYKSELKEIYENIRLTIDYPEDFEVFKVIIKHIGEKFKTIKLQEIVDLYNKLNLYSVNGKKIEEYKDRILSQGNFKSK